MLDITMEWFNGGVAEAIAAAKAKSAVFVVVVVGMNTEPSHLRSKHKK